MTSRSVHRMRTYEICLPWKRGGADGAFGQHRRLALLDRQGFAVQALRIKGSRQIVAYAKANPEASLKLVLVDLLTGYRCVHSWKLASLLRHWWPVLGRPAQLPVIYASCASVEFVIDGAEPPPSAILHLHVIYEDEK